MNAKVTIDNAGRLVLPKAFREALRIEPGDTLEIESDDDRLVISPVRLGLGLQKEQGVWVCRSGRPASDSISDLIDRQRRQRTQELLEGRS